MNEEQSLAIEKPINEQSSDYDTYVPMSAIDALLKQVKEHAMSVDVRLTDIESSVSSLEAYLLSSIDAYAARKALRPEHV